MDAKQPRLTSGLLYGLRFIRYKLVFQYMKTWKTVVLTR